MKAGWVLPETFSGRDLSEARRIRVDFPGVCGSLTVCVLSRALLLRFTSAWTAAARVTGDERMDMLRGADRRLGVCGLVGAEVPFERSVLERTLGMPVLLEGPARDTIPLLAPIPLRTGFFKFRVSSFDVGEAGVDPSRKSPSLSFLHLEHRLGVGLGSGDVRGDKAS